MSTYNLKMEYFQEDATWKCRAELNQSCRSYLEKDIDASLELGMMQGSKTENSDGTATYLITLQEVIDFEILGRYFFAPMKKEVNRSFKMER